MEVGSFGECGDTPLALALGFDGIETKLWLISQNRDAFNQKD